jgi:membrane fusion protein (multidrug efflux system)
MNEREYLDFFQNSEGKDIETKIKNLPKVTLSLANGSQYDLEGTIETINSQINANTGAISFRAIFDNPSRLLTNGNSGKIRVPKEYKDAVVVPKTATYEQQGSIYAYKVVEDGMATATRIAVLDDIDNVYVISDGLKPGDQIVAKGVAKLRGNTQIKPMKIPFDSVAKPIEKVFR